jgi:hypothetical protein
MEKTFWNTKIVFKEQITMKDRQILSNCAKKRQENGDEIQLAFDAFPVRVLTIDWKVLTDAEKKERIENLTDLNLFKEIWAVISELQTKATGIDEKKKIG